MGEKPNAVLLFLKRLGATFVLLIVAVLYWPLLPMFFAWDFLREGWSAMVKSIKLEFASLCYFKDLKDILTEIWTSFRWAS